jgi:hypothetical protein
MVFLLKKITVRHDDLEAVGAGLSDAENGDVKAAFYPANPFRPGKPLDFPVRGPTFLLCSR